MQIEDYLPGIRLVKGTLGIWIADCEMLWTEPVGPLSVVGDNGVYTFRKTSPEFVIMFCRAYL